MATRQTFFDIEVTGGDKIAQALRDRTLFMAPVERRMIRAAGVAGEKTARRAAKPHAQDKGTLGRAVRLDFRDSGETAVVDIARSVVGIAQTIEEGRRPGRRPPYRAIKAWAESHGVIPVGRGNSRHVQELREKIARSGTRGVHFMREAAEVADRVIHDGIPPAETDIATLWERKT